MSPQLLDEAKIDSGLLLLPLPPQESRHQGGDSTWAGGPLPPLLPCLESPIPLKSDSPGVLRIPAGCSSASPLHRERRGGPRATPSPQHWAQQGEGERAAPAPTAAAICSPTSISLVPTRANYRVNHCARGSGGGKREGRGPGWSSPGALDRLKPVQAPGEAVAESPSPPSPAQSSGNLSHPVLDPSQMEMERGSPSQTPPTSPGPTPRLCQLQFPRPLDCKLRETEPVCCLSCTP